MPTLRKILIANRGEIAVRILRTCGRMGIRAVAVFSEADRNALHVRQADEAVAIDSYLNIERILEAARRAGAEAIHPGYGFLAENADFAAACEAAGLVFIGPPAEVIRRMGNKTAGRALAESLGVPVVPGAEGGFPLLIKAAAGGGGRGMRVVHNAADFPALQESAAREAEKAFGDGALLVAKYIPDARHVEVQILGDRHGSLIHLHERECSLQRRYQKLIEESPSPAVDDRLRGQLTEAALAIGRALNYSSAGTVEFLLVPSGEFYFIEVNTRIQVEHPVTEMRTGLDLIAMQIEVAEGKRLALRQEDIRPAGHAIEVRLCAEDPATGFLPATGTLHVWEPPETGPCLRLDTAAEQGLEVGIHYDSLLAKIIAHGPDRESALRRLVHALEHLAVQGVTTNREFLIRVLESEEFRAGRVHTGFLETFPAAAPSHPEADFPFTMAAALYAELREHAARAILPAVAPNYRNNPYRDPSADLAIGEEEWELSWRHHGGGRYTAHSGEMRAEVEVVGCGDGSIRLAIEGVQRIFHVKQVQVGDEFLIRAGAGGACRTVRRLPRHPPPESVAQRETANSPMPGQVLRILVKEGQEVQAGDPLIVLEAMKMEQTIKTTIHGIVGAVLVQPGQIVMPGQMLVEIQAVSTEKSHGHASH